MGHPRYSVPSPPPRKGREDPSPFLATKGSEASAVNGPHTAHSPWTATAHP